MKKFLLLLSVGLATFSVSLGLYITFGFDPEMTLSDFEGASYLLSSGKLATTAALSGVLSFSTLLAGAFYPVDRGVDLHV